MGEGVLVEGLGRGDDPGGECLVDRVQSLVLGHAGDLSGDADGEAGVEEGADGEQLVRRSRELGEAPPEDLPDALGDDVDQVVGRHPDAVLEAQGAGLAQVQQQLTEEERVAVGLARQQHGELVRDRLPGHLFQEGVHLLDGQAGEDQSGRLDLSP